MLSYGFEPPYVRYHVVDTSGRLVRTVDVDLPAAVMVHDVGLTATNVVLFDLPVIFDMDLALNGTALPFRWRPTTAPGSASCPGPDRPVWIDVEPCYVYHPLNAYDDGDRVVIDLVVHDRVFAPRTGTPPATRPRCSAGPSTRWPARSSAR